MNETALEVIREQIGDHKKYVFVRKTKSGKVYPLRVYSNQCWNTALRKAGIDNFRFHDLRHTWASWLTQSGVPESVLQELGGWQSREILKRYVHLSPVHLAQHSKQIDNFL